MDWIFYLFILSILVYIYVSYCNLIIWLKVIVFFFLYLLKGFYLYYFDKVFLVWKLEINWRFLEEYFFSVGIVDVLDFDVFVVLEDVFV